MRYAKLKWSFVLWFGVFFVTSGATCIPRRSHNEFQPPALFQTAPDINQLTEVINRTRAIQQLQSNAVTVRIPDVPTLSAKIVWERPRRFRMTGGLSRMTGTDFDLGSNDDVFWMATRHGPSPTLYYARHDQFASQIDRQILPVSPEWLIEAMGIVDLDPNTMIGTPRPQADGLIEIESAIASPIGQYRRTILVDPKYGLVRQILLRDPSGRLIGSSILSNHQYYQAIQTSLPHNAKVQLIPSGGPPMNLEVDVGFYTVNDNQGQDDARWTPPQPAGYTTVDLVQFNGGQPVAVRAPEYQVAPVIGPSTSYRGVLNMER
ncbi:MAG: hypothetical protein SGI77_06100 [Pirellulaceae bacterium]|nr:hypothetical protein [Pirellulaceae bacterium]